MPLTPVTPGTLPVHPQFTVTDGSTDVVHPSVLEFDGATVAESPAGTALVTVSGGSQPSDAIYLECNTAPSDGGSAVWDTIYDRRGFPHTLAEIPSDYGLSLSGGAITTEETGKWLLELMCNPAADETAKGKVTLSVQGDYTGGPTIDMPSLSSDLITVEACLQCFADLDAGNVITVSGSSSGATAPDYKMIGYAVLKIIRFA